jgi:metal-responsive CopG/Arc/MetJ family transcriptional regulator
MFDGRIGQRSTFGRKDGITMANIKTAVSIPERLFQQAEALAHEMNISRSRLFSLALEEFIRRQETRKLVESINAAYEDGLDEEEQAMLKGMLALQRQVFEAEDNEW